MAVEKRTILIQFDTDPQPSVFDRVVAVDAGADQLFSYGGVTADQVRDLVHGAIFTRGPKHLKRTALFIGGSDVAAGERLLAEACRHMLPQFGLQISILLDSNGANTTSAAAVWSAAQHLDLHNARALVLGGTGPVGQRVARLLARAGAEVLVGSRQRTRAEGVCAAIRAKVASARVAPAATASNGEIQDALNGCTLVVAAGAAGIQLLPQAVWTACPTLRVAIDLNAVPPLGIEGIDLGDKASLRGDTFCFGAIGVGAAKLKLHKAAIAKLFESNNQVLDAEEVYALTDLL